MDVLNRAVEELGDAASLDDIGGPLSSFVSKSTQSTPLKNALTGTWLGHPLHPLLTDIPIGCWVGASFLDVFGSKSAARSAQNLVGLGIIASIPTAASGASDWSDTIGAEQRIGLVHALLNVGAVSLQTASYLARRRDRRGKGFVLSAAALGAVSAAGYLGGHLSYVLGTGVNHTAFEEPKAEWTDVAALSELNEGELTQVSAAGVPVVVVRRGESVDALSATCVHAGGPLNEGEIVGDCVRCPWHSSEFRLSDGKVERGPASMDQPAWDTRVSDGRLSVRPRSMNPT